LGPPSSRDRVPIAALQQLRTRWWTSNAMHSWSEKAGIRMPARRRRPAVWVLLLLPFIGLLWVPFYNFQEPALFGFPFFYWYQLAWVPITSLLVWLVYRSRPHDEAQ
jgi:Protein of unknown function (DUF3311)